jgi:hypothetical protein
MALLAWLSKSWHIAGVAGLLLTYPLLIYSGQFILAQSIPLFILLTAIPSRRVQYPMVTLFGNVLGIACLGLLYPTWQETTAQKKLIGTSSANIGDVDLTQKPSIIHIVLDAYGSSDILSELYNHDNSGFIASLEAKGFLVMPKVASPFSQTLFTMSSVFSGGYINTPDQSENVRAFRLDLGHTIKNAGVMTAFRKANYNFGYSKSGYSYLDLDDAELITPSTVMTGFEAYLLRYFPILHTWQRSEEIKAAFKPENFNKLDSPFFYYQHVVAPHPSFVLKADGQMVSNNMSAVLINALPNTEGYVEQASFVEQAVLAQINAIPDDIPIVVIIHGDHGPAAFYPKDASIDQPCMKERLTTFFAVYSNVPEIQSAFSMIKASEFNLANIYRIVLSAISDTSFDLLPGESRFMWWATPHDIKLVSDDTLLQSCTTGN